MPPAPEHSIIGVFKGMGDLLWAVPVIRAELDRGQSIHLLIFPSPAMLQLCSLIDFGPNAHNLNLQPVPTTLPALPAFFAKMRTLRPQYVWISPHAPAADSSWRVPLLLRLTQQLFWRNTSLVGAQSERLSALFHRKLSLDRTLPLPLREWAAYREFRTEAAVTPPRPAFVSSITDARTVPPLYDLVIHPGATAANRVWPPDKYPALLAALPMHWRVAIVGLPQDLAAITHILPADLAGRCVQVSGTLQQMLQTLAAARRVLVMNSGPMHFAEVLQVPTLAIFGQQHPSQVIGHGWVSTLYQPSVRCQPCRRGTCNQPQVYCLTNIDPLTVAQRLIDLDSTTVPTDPPLTQIRQQPN